ncbi:MAG TPA: methyltransferase [Gemmata sp.]
MIAERFLQMAERLRDEVSDKRRPRRENTPKQRREAKSQRIEADLLERVMLALQRLAGAHTDGTIPAALAGIKSKAELLTMLRTRTDSHSYYDVHDTGVYPDTSPTAVALREWMKDRPDPELVARAAVREMEEAERAFRPGDIPGFFPTPPEVAQRVAFLADLSEGMRVLEPSAGTGRLVSAALAVCPLHVAAVERHRSLSELLTKKFVDTGARGRVKVTNRDFLEVKPEPRADRIIMNPPFECGADIRHVEHALKFLAPGGRLVAIVAGGPRQRERFGSGEWYDLPDGSFKESGTGVSAAVIAINAD